MKDAVFVTGNQHKADLLARLLGSPIKHEKANVDEIQALDIAVVGEHKAKQAFALLGRPVLVDDFGTYIDAFDGLPGAFTKFFVDADNGMEMTCRMLDAFETRTAIATSVMVYYDGKELRLFRGEVRGVIADHPRGERGIGTDMIFIPDGYNGRTRAELSETEYDEVYMRVRPIEQVRGFLESLHG